MKKLWLWYLLLTTRLLKKPSFLAVLLLAPLLALSLTLLAKEEAHIVKIAVYTEKSADPLGEQITDELLELDGVIEYIPCDTENEPVSYTHLDVYKRQALTRSSFQSEDLSLSRLLNLFV